MTRYDFPPRPPEAMLPISRSDARAPRVAAYVDTFEAVHFWEVPEEAPAEGAA